MIDSRMYSIGLLRGSSPASSAKHGVYTADPRKVPTAKKLDEISYDDMLHMALNGAQVLHSRCVEMAKKFEIPLVVRSSMNEREGTVVREKTVCPCR